MTSSPLQPHQPVAPFDRAQLATLDALMDLLIPASRDGRMPSARSLALYADASRLPARDRALFDGLQCPPPNPASRSSMGRCLQR